MPNCICILLGALLTPLGKDYENEALSETSSKLVELKRTSGFLIRIIKGVNFQSRNDCLTLKKAWWYQGVVEIGKCFHVFFCDITTSALQLKLFLWCNYQTKTPGLG